MTNLQLLLSIGIPALLIVLSWLQQSTRMTRLEAAVDRVDNKVDAVDRKFDNKLDAVRKEMIELRDSIHRDMITLHERVAIVESKSS